MIIWGIGSLVVLAVLGIALAIWILSEYRSGRDRRKFLSRYPERSVEGLRSRIARDLANADTDVIPKLPRGRFPRDSNLDGSFRGTLPLPGRPRVYVRQPVRHTRELALPPPDDELIKRILEGLRKLK